MNGREYQDLAMRTNDGNAKERLLNKMIINDFFKLKKAECPDANYDMGGIINGCLGLSGEVGEFNDMIKKWIFHEKNLDVKHAQKELGDVLWYIAMICQSFDWDMNQIMQMNIDKLKARYPDGFDVELSTNRKESDV